MIGRVYLKTLDGYIELNSDRVSNNSTKLIEIVSDEISLQSNEVKYITLDVGFNKYDLRTLKCISNNIINIKIYESDILTWDNCIYDSIDSKGIYDIINIPVIDKTNSKKYIYRYRI